MREFDLLEHVYQYNSVLNKRCVIGPGDDLAMVSLDNSQLLAGVDQLVVGRHVDTATPIELIGRKAIARSVSDIAAMAASPVGSLVAVTLPPNFGENRARALFDAMRATAEQMQCALIGGDIAFHREPSHPLVCSVTVLAAPASGVDRVLTRAGAKVGDRVYVTGSLGGSFEADGGGRHLRFEPRVALAIELARLSGDRLHAMIDLSDGLGRDVSHIAAMSNVSIQLDASGIPCNAGCDWRQAIGDGEDYELCFCATGELPAELLGVKITEVGQVDSPGVETDSPRVVVIDGETIHDVTEFGWQHQS